ncbi:MAG: metalloregulator ArsR/SmtB family transcription factor [Pseudomonadota bacterium]|nr:metalloregulator ArsR/SmtB family transcription factor [Gammaproteobacteria bacterium]
MLKQQSAEQAAKSLKALAHPERLLILCRLIEGEKSVGTLWKSSNLSQSSFSQHLAVLRKEHIVQVRKETQTVFYSLLDQNVQLIMKTFKKICC